MHVAVRTGKRVNLDEPKIILVVDFLNIETMSYAHEFSWK